MKLPRRIKKKPRRTAAIRCPGHLADIRQHECALKDKISAPEYAECLGPIHAHHTVTKGAGGGDEGAVPLCSKHHDYVHVKGRNEFWDYLTALAADMWAVSGPGQRYRAKLKQENG